VTDGTITNGLLLDREAARQSEVRVDLVRPAISEAPRNSETREGPSVSTPASEIKFTNTGVKTEKGELRAGPAYGELRLILHF
jgi:hypothetical protein